MDVEVRIYGFHLLRGSQRKCGGAVPSYAFHLFHGSSGASAPKRVNRAHGPTKENRQKFDIFWIFPAHAKNWLRWAQIGPGGFFPTNPDLADILGRTDLDFEIFFDFLDPTFLNFQVPRFPKSGPWLGLGQARFEPAGPKNADFSL